MIRAMKALAATLALSLSTAATARAQDNYEIQVYGSETMAPHTWIS